MSEILGVRVPEIKDASNVNLGLAPRSKGLDPRGQDGIVSLMQ
jgi:hypothetical protein